MMLKPIGAVILAGTLLIGAAAADDGNGLSNTVARAIEDGTVKLSFRYRFEFVDEDGFNDDAYANTLRSRLSFAPQITDDWGVLLEFDDVRQVQSSKFNDTRNNNTGRPQVIDPEGTDLNQALVRFTGIDNTALAVGRQRIDRLNQRFVGGVAWRQNEQTFDSFTADYGEEGPFQAFYSYVFQVNRIHGPDSGSPPADLDSDTHLLDASYSFGKALKLSAYGYLIDISDNDAFSNQTVGARVDGKLGVGEETSVSYLAEYAYQEDYADNPVSYDADYYRFEAGVNFRRVELSAGYEVLGGNQETAAAFRTPLATLHKFQGWSDRFLGVSGNGTYDPLLGGSGIEDFYVSVTANVLGGKIAVIYHDFEAETGGQEWGQEWDAQANWKFGDHYGLLLKLASYDADNFPVNEADVTKFWVQLTADF